MDYIITNGELYHHGIKGMKWGVRRFQNKDGSLTDAGKQRLSEGLKKNFNSQHSAKKYKANVVEAANKGLTADDKKQVLDARAKLVDAVEKAELAELELMDLAEQYAFDYYSRKYNANPEKYENDADANDQLMMDAYNVYGYSRAERSRPDLVKEVRYKDECTEAYVKAVRDAADKLVGEYGNVKMYDFIEHAPTIKESMFNTIAEMDFDLSESKSRRRLFK